MCLMCCVIVGSLSFCSCPTYLQLMCFMMLQCIVLADVQTKSSAMTHYLNRLTGSNLYFARVWTRIMRIPLKWTDFSLKCLNTGATEPQYSALFLLFSLDQLTIWCHTQPLLLSSISIIFIPFTLAEECVLISYVMSQSTLRWTWSRLEALPKASKEGHIIFIFIICCRVCCFSLSYQLNKYQNERSWVDLATVASYVGLMEWCAKETHYVHFRHPKER